MCYTAIFSCDQAALWMVQSVRLSVRTKLTRPDLHHVVSLFILRDVQCCGKSKIQGRLTDHPWLMVGWADSVLGSPSIIYWDHEMIKSIKELVKIRQSVFTLYSDTSTNRHTDGFLQDCSISSALAMEILQPCVKPWIWYHCICGVVCPLFFRNIFCKT